jgi:uncharacterized membrane protein (Fun14 family)
VTNAPGGKVSGILTLGTIFGLIVGYAVNNAHSPGIAAYVGGVVLGIMACALAADLD